MRVTKMQVRTPFSVKASPAHLDKYIAHLLPGRRARRPRYTGASCFHAMTLFGITTHPSRLSLRGTQPSAGQGAADHKNDGSRKAVAQKAMSMIYHTVVKLR